ncbi:MAG: hypothetical protein MK098_04110 [Marinovum sp.]|nr:hypothetical protein [Marinovum sp.]
MRQRFKRFLQEEDGAVTVDWVVITAGVVGLAVGIYGTLEANTIALGDAAAVAVTGENDF